MADREHAALDEYSLIARALHEVEEVDSRLQLLGVSLTSPILPFGRGALTAFAPLGLIEARELPASSRGETVPVLPNGSMGELMPRIKELGAQEFPAIALDLRPLANSAPFGSEQWRPRSREELAELRAASGCPLWVYGVSSAADAEVVVEAGLEGVVVTETLGRRLGGPTSIEVLPEILDSVAGMIGVLVGSPVRSGIDVFRYLAVGAEAVIVESERPLASLEDELQYVMRLTGCATLADIGYECIYAPLFDEL